MARIKLNAWWTWPLIVGLTPVMMSFEDPFRIALAALMLAATDPVRRLILTLDPVPQAASAPSSR